MREQTKKDIYAAHAVGVEYDRACKRVFQNREIIAPILQMVVPEYEGCTVKEVLRYIEEDTIRDVPVEDIPERIEGMPKELSSVTEKLIRYDVHFKCVNPGLTGAEICIHLHVDLEVQNDYRPRNPSYPIIKRAIYYAVRELSAQLGSLTETTDYSALEKVYSIWICNKNVPLVLRDTLTSYSIRRTDLIGVTEEPEEEYDLLNVIMIRRGGKSKDKIFDFLRAVFDGEIGKLEEYTYISQNAVLRQEVEHMSGLGASIYEEGMEQGIEKGMEQGVERATENFIRRMFDGNESLEKIATYAGCTVEEVLRIKETFEGDAE